MSNSEPFSNYFSQIHQCSDSKRFREIVHWTPIQISTSLSTSLSSELSQPDNSDSAVVSSSSENHIVAFKCEHLQQTGSFKLRGITNCLLQHAAREGDPSQSSLPTFYTASTGNHGFAAAYATLKLPPLKTKIFVPVNADESKIKRIQQCVQQSNGRISMEQFGTNCLDSEVEAKKHAQMNGGIYVSPYNDAHVLTGQGTIGMEVASQFASILGENSDGFDAVFVSVGGGGMISGISIALKNQMLKQGKKIPKIYGVQPTNSSVMYQSIQEGKILQNVEESQTLSDGTAGGIEEESITFDVCQQMVDEWVCCSEEEIYSAWLHLMDEERMLVEGSAALALAGYLQVQSQLKNQSVCIVLCGRNITMSKTRKLIQRANIHDE